jgi:phosphoglycerate kinase
MTIKYIDQIDIKGKRVILRVDFNVPYDDNMNITDDTRITATAPTIEYCLKNNARLILISHLGRPKGKFVPEMSLKPVAKRLSEILKREIKFLDTPLGDDLNKQVLDLKEGEIALLENIRFYPGEEKNDDDLGKKIASLGEVYIDDAFAAAHRGHSSNDAVTRHIAACGAGFLLKDEIEYFNRAMKNPERPVCAIIGGAKVSTKLDALRNILVKVDSILIGGGMAFTFLKAKGLGIGKSLLEEDLVDTAAQIMKEAELKKVNLLLPIDIEVANEFNNESPSRVVPADDIPEDTIGLDIGPETINLFNDVIAKSRTVIWNGPMGAFEMPNFANGTNSIAQKLAESSCLSIVGGGDSVTAVNQAGVSDKISYISTGGGAFLELLEGKTLPGLAALDK